MDNFIFHNPTRLIFGKGMIAQLSQQIPADKRIMITFGGGSVKTNGVYEQVIQALEGRDYTEFWGIESNPDISTLKKAIESGKEKNIDFLLAVGGGSVIDGTKLISAGIPYNGDAWELVKKGSAQNTIPLGTVLTIPATGSEMNNGAVISCRETHEKYPFFSSHPVFSKQILQSACILLYHTRNLSIYKDFFYKAISPLFTPRNCWNFLLDISKHGLYNQSMARYLM